ncbi:MAG: hypothetical protein ACOX6T_05675 [Myxococcales bacterium]|jgi:hypothetical protein
MTPRELRRAMRERRRELRRAVRKLRRQARADAERIPVVQKEKQRRRRRRLTALLAVLLLALLLTRCECQPAPAIPPEAEPAPEVVPEEPEPVPAKKAEVKKNPLKATTKRRRRAGYEEAARAGPPWLEDFRLQVAARSARLAQCFTGSERPGALRWSTAVDPESGAVADHEVDPVGPSAELSLDQRKCLVGVLSDPVYRLTDQQKQGLPSRISLAIEF